MKVTVIKDKSLHRIKAIHNLSRKYNKRLSNNHTFKLLELIKEHAKEIQQLHKARDKHYLVETGDLIVLCFEVLLENNASIDKTLLKCFKRYEKRFSSLACEERK